jgi:hypothetical protein
VFSGRLNLARNRNFLPRDHPLAPINR